MDCFYRPNSLAGNKKDAALSDAKKIPPVKGFSLIMSKNNDKQRRVQSFKQRQGVSSVAKRLSRWAHMFLFGLSSFQLDKIRRRQRRRVLRRKFLTASERWAILGDRLRKAAEKVVGQNEHG